MQNRAYGATNRMLKDPASFVLASFRPSTYPMVRLGLSLAATLLNGLFEHPECRTSKFIHQNYSSAAKFQRMKAEAGDEMTAGGPSRQQSYAILPEVAAGSHE